MLSESSTNHLSNWRLGGVAQEISMGLKSYFNGIFQNLKLQMIPVHFLIIINTFLEFFRTKRPKFEIFK